MRHNRFGLIGHPIAHSLSPALFKAGYEGRYPYELIEGEDFELSYKRFIEEDYAGINVTAPFKELAFAKADILSPECEAVGATNLLVKTPQGVKAFNSDFLGVRMWLEETTADLLSGRSVTKRTPPIPIHPTMPCSLQKPTGLFVDRSRPHAARGVARFSYTDLPYSNNDSLSEELSVLIVGMGGAGKAAAAAGESLGMKVIRMNRTVRDERTRALEDFRECFREADIIIYNIPTAIPALNELTDNDFNPGRTKFILEANYKNPSFDKALQDKMQAANPLIRYTGGKTWLLYQAVTGYEIFTGEKPDLERMSDVL